MLQALKSSHIRAQRARVRARKAAASAHVAQLGVMEIKGWVLNIVVQTEPKGLQPCGVGVQTETVHQSRGRSKRLPAQGDGRFRSNMISPLKERREDIRDSVVHRPPIGVLQGHSDHGKTLLSSQLSRLGLTDTTRDDPASIPDLEQSGPKRPDLTSAKHRSSSRRGAACTSRPYVCTTLSPRCRGA